MKFFNKVLETLKRNSKLTKSQDSDDSSILQFEDNDNEFEKMFIEYDTFKSGKQTEINKITFYFTPDINSEDKKILFNHISYGLSRPVNPIAFLYDTSAEFKLTVSIKSVPEEHKLKLFIGNLYIETK